ncbi:hypothetical protein IKP85_07340 [bacterium]|nr:hypothetical protein [bacterium]
MQTNNPNQKVSKADLIIIGIIITVFLGGPFFVLFMPNNPNDIMGYFIAALMALFPVAIFYAFIAYIGVIIWSVNKTSNIVQKEIQKKYKVKYHINFWYLFLTVVSSIILILFVYALFTVPNSEKHFIHFSLMHKSIPATICIIIGGMIFLATKIVTKIPDETNHDKEK